MSKKIVTISRRFGRGGRSIGKEAAGRLQVEYYDKELIKEVAEKTGFCPEFIEEQGEYAPGRTMLSYAFAYHGPQESPAVMNAADLLWMMQRQVILELTEKGP